MARIHTHYDNLKVARNAPPEVIRAAYKTLSQKYHPDRNPGNHDAVRIIQIINNAYEVLSDPVKRREHDEWIARAEAEAEKNKQRQRRPQPSFAYTADMQGNCKPEGSQRHARSSRHRSHRQAAPTPADMVNMARLLFARFSKYIFRKA
jgi:DnaJ-class molecular chaperone